MNNKHIENGIKWLKRHASLLYKPLLNNTLCHHGIKGQQWGVKNGPPYPLSKQKTVTNSAGETVREVTAVKLTGEHPNAITQIVRKNGGIDRNFYDDSGRQIKQISNNNHNKPGKHPYGKEGEHAHDYIYNKDGKLIGRPTRELTEQERKDNGDFL